MYFFAYFYQTDCGAAVERRAKRDLAETPPPSPSQLAAAGRRRRSSVSTSDYFLVRSSLDDLRLFGQYDHLHLQQGDNEEQPCFFTEER